MSDSAEAQDEDELQQVAMKKKMWKILTFSQQNCWAARSVFRDNDKHKAPSWNLQSKAEHTP